MKAAGVESSMQSILQWISQSPGMWLLVIDNTDDIPGTTTKYIPLGNHRNVLIMSQNLDARWLVLPGVHAKVKEMEEEDAVLLLLKAVFLTDALQDVKHTAKIIVQTLYCLAPSLHHHVTTMSISTITTIFISATFISATFISTMSIISMSTMPASTVASVPESATP
jgi:hypothetical protein